MNRQLSMALEDHHPILVLRLEGFLAQLEVYKFKNKVEALLREGNKYVIVDLSEVNFLDSAGLGSLIQLRHDFLAQGGQIYVVGSTNRQVRQAYDESTIAMVVPRFGDLPTAIDKLARQCNLSLAAKDPAANKPAIPIDHPVQRLATEELIDVIRQLAQRAERMEQRLKHIERMLSAPRTPKRPVAKPAAAEKS